MRFTFPPGSTECMAGDYLLYPQADAQWHVYLVEDVLAIKRLVASATSPITLIPEDTLLDSVTPAYFGEAHLLLTVFDPVFADEDAARQAIRNKTLVERVRGLLRTARDFPKGACQVMTP